MTDKFIGYFRLIDACRMPGCSVCRCLTDDGRRHLDAPLYEHVNDPDTRRRLRAAWGLCNWRSWMLRTVATAADTAIDLVDDPQFVRAYTNSSGPCAPHVVLTFARRPGTPQLRQLLDQTIGKWERLRYRLDDFVRKHEYRNTEPISESEAAACTTILEMVAGGPGVFGNDLHSDTDERRAG